MKPTCKVTQSELKSYRFVEFPEAAKYSWECALIVTDEDPGKTTGQYYTHHGGCGNDYKYSREMVNRELRLKRSMTISEFYGNSTVD